jgi:hypothetical protein
MVQLWEGKASKEAYASEYHPRYAEGYNDPTDHVVVAFLKDDGRWYDADGDRVEVDVSNVRPIEDLEHFFMDRFDPDGPISLALTREEYCWWLGR